MTNPIKRKTKKLPEYFGRLFEDRGDAQDWLRRIASKMGADYSTTYEHVRVDGFEVYHAYVWRS